MAAVSLAFTTGVKRQDPWHGAMPTTQFMLVAVAAMTASTGQRPMAPATKHCINFDLTNRIQSAQ